MRVLYYDCFSGISGDMHLGAMIDLGVKEEYLVKELNKLPLSGEYVLDVQKGIKNGISGTKVDVKLTHHHEHHHGHHHHHHRTFADIESIISKSTLSSSIIKRSLAMFWCIAEAEAKIHGKTPHEVCFHEVGAIDSIVDIVGAAICLEALHVDKIIASKVELGGGFVTCAHGIIPIPSPATLAILKNVPVTLGRVNFETTTPTGAAILAVNVEAFDEKLDFIVEKIGYGLGTRSFEIPNVLRLILGEVQPTTCLYEEILLETNIDDMSPEVLAYAQERLFDAGALDVFTTAITTKKNRLGVKLSVLTCVEKEAAIIDLILQETTSIGLRRQVVQKIALKREIVLLETHYGTIHIKCTYQEAKMLRYKAEYEDCKAAALAHHVPIMKIYDEVHRAMEQKCIPNTNS